VTVTAGELATEEEMSTDDPDILEEKVAGYDPEELGATTSPLESIIAASRASLPPVLAPERTKVPIEKVTIVSAAMSTLNVI
jgi:hypothetical protein